MFIRVSSTSINTIPEATLLAFAKAGIDDDQLAADLQREGTESFVKSWKDLLDRIRSKHTALKAGG